MNGQQHRQAFPSGAQQCDRALDLPHSSFQRVASVQLPILGEVR